MAFFSKAVAKVRILFHIFQIFSKVFFIYFSEPLFKASREKGKSRSKNVSRSTTSLSECHCFAALVLESGCKSRGFIDNLQIYPTLFFCIFLKVHPKALCYRCVAKHIFSNQRFYLNWHTHCLFHARDNHPRFPPSHSKNIS